MFVALVSILHVHGLVSVRRISEYITCSWTLSVRRSSEYSTYSWTLSVHGLLMFVT